ncbi:MAG: FKBP-type peptidyl-prolyl cis-trans isomerase [Bacteroidales bacterium]|nr:FKBP-type peptidyl-prolyl cis-trans isomerase [Bacteroidales bacterium]
MKKVFKFIALSVAAMVMLTSCNNDGWKTTKDGLEYRFIEINKDAQQVKAGDVLVGTCILKLNDSVLINVDKPDRILMASPSVFKGDLSEGLLMMHLGDKAVFGVSADSLYKFGFRFPPFYKEGTGMKLYYEINLTDIITQDEIAQEQALFEENYKQLQDAERETLAKYVEDNKINATPDEDGLYIVVNKKGKGNKVEIGRNVAINYTGRLLDGKIFDTSVEKVAKDNGIYDPSRQYAPLSYTVGSMSLIRGWDKGVINQPEGSKLTLIIPSWLGYGQKGNSDRIPPNSPLLFEIEIVSVK